MDRYEEDPWTLRIFRFLEGKAEADCYRDGLRVALDEVTKTKTRCGVFERRTKELPDDPDHFLLELVRRLGQQVDEILLVIHLEL